MVKKSDKNYLKDILLVLIVLLILACERNTDPINPTDITGVYTCQESSVHSGVRKYFVEIDRVKNEQDLFIISNFHNKGENEFLFADLKQDTLWIVNQAILDIIVEGEGPVGEDFRSISLYYKTDDGTTILDYFANFNR